jgi:NTE family protein
MLFHAGSLCRLNEAGWLGKFDAITSVSGGSIAAGLLGAVWKKLIWDEEGVATNFDKIYLQPLIAFSLTAVDFPCILYGVAAPWTTAASEVVKRYRALLGSEANLNKLPERPRFIFCSSNLTTGSLFRFSKRYVADYRLGQHFSPDLDLAIPVAASAAFPPFVSPLRLDLRPFKFEMRPVNGRTPLAADPSLLARAVLTDGGVYDNHGVQPLLNRCKTLLVSDGGAPWSTSTGGFYRWSSQLKRVFDTTDNQVRALRRQDLMGRLIGSNDPALSNLPEDSAIKHHFSLRGAYWAVSSDPARYPAHPYTPVVERWHELAKVGTWLHFLGSQETEDLVNWGYVMSDLALRSYVDPSLPAGKSTPVAPGQVQPGRSARASKFIERVLFAS